MTDMTQEKIINILGILKSSGILKGKVKPSEIADVYDLWGTIANECEDYTTEIWPEDFGSDREAGEDYERVLHIFERLSHGGIKYENLTSSTQGDSVELSFSIEGNAHTIKFQQYSDGFSEEFVTEIINKSKSFKNGRIVTYSGGDVPEFAYLPHEVANILCDYEIFE